MNWKDLGDGEAIILISHAIVLEMQTFTCMLRKTFQKHFQVWGFHWLHIYFAQFNFAWIQISRLVSTPLTIGCPKVPIYPWMTAGDGMTMVFEGQTEVFRSLTFFELMNSCLMLESTEWITVTTPRATELHSSQLSYLLLHRGKWIKPT